MGNNVMIDSMSRRSSKGENWSYMASEALKKEGKMP